GFYHTGIFLLNEAGDEAVLQAASSEGGARMMERGHALAVGTQGIVGHVAAQKKPRIALDVGEDAVFFNNPDLPMTRSELALPLMVHNRVLGILDIQSDKPQAFGVDDIDVLQTLADQVAIAIENARLLDESQATLSQLEALTAVRTRDVWSQKLRERNRVFTYTPLGLRAEKIAPTQGQTLTVPLMLRGQKIGNISIARRGDSGMTRRDEELIAEVASQAGLAIDNIRLLEDATQRANQEQIVGQLASRFSQSLDTDTLLQTAVRELAQLSDVTEVSIFVGKQSGDSPSNRNGKRTTG
ncbi:MAG TPA: GAF domain-containing protein, partial [Anaerolineales bacterium]|nr:GAF domain-containing protein [Anaerolineales bacterium]